MSTARPTALPAARPAGSVASGPSWVGPSLVAIALVSLVTWAVVFVRTPLASMPLYFAAGYFVLDATSMLFLLVINAVFLGISVYMSSGISTSAHLTETIRRRAVLSLAFMLAMNLGVMCNHLLVLWAFIELTTLCLAPLVAQGDGLHARRIAWHYLLYSSMSLALTFLGFMCLTRSAALQGLALSFAIDRWRRPCRPAPATATAGNGWALR